MLVGDGWEKDGDYNTGFSQTVLPLPSHAQPAYGKGVPEARAQELELEADPVYQAHREDWERFHTRFVRPERLRRAGFAGPRPSAEGRSYCFHYSIGRAPNGSVYSSMVSDRRQRVARIVVGDPVRGRRSRRFPC